MTPTHPPGRVTLPSLPSLPEQTRTPPSPAALESFNTAPTDEVRQTLLTCLSSPRWADRITGHRPYPDLDALLAASDEAAYDLTPGELAQALAAESLPVLPERVYGAAHTALNAAHTAYQGKFGHTFVICLDDLPPSEALDRVLHAIRSRLANDLDDERALTAEELRRLARGRLVQHLRTAGR